MSKETSIGEDIVAILRDMQALAEVQHAVILELGKSLGIVLQHLELYETMKRLTDTYDMAAAVLHNGADDMKNRREG